MTRHLLRRMAAYPAALLALAAIPLNAAVITYQDAASWNAATSSSTMITFEGPAPAFGYQDYSNSTGYLVSGIDFLGYQSPSAYNLQIVGGGPSWYNWGSGSSLKGPGYDTVTPGFTPYIQVVLPASITAFSVDLMTGNPNSTPYQVTVGDSSSVLDTYTVNTLNNPNQTYFGVTSDTPISYVNFSLIGTTPGNGSYGLLDNFTTALASVQSTGTSGGGSDPGTPPDTSAVPETASFFSVGLGMTALALIRRVRV